MFGKRRVILKPRNAAVLHLSAPLRVRCLAWTTPALIVQISRGRSMRWGGLSRLELGMAECSVLLFRFRHETTSSPVSVSIVLFLSLRHRP